MSKFETQINPTDENFKRNAEIMQQQVQDLQIKLQEIYQGGNDKSRERHLRHGKLSPRDRIQLLLDSGSQFLELSALAGYELYDEARLKEYEISS